MYLNTDGFIPYDGVPNIEEVTVSHAVTVLFVLLATIGIVFSIACLSFSVVFRKKRCGALLIIRHCV